MSDRRNTEERDIAVDGKVEGVISWILGNATNSDDVIGLLTGLLERLEALGTSAWHASLSMATIDPLLRGISILCWSDRPSATEAVLHAPSGDDPFEQGPIFYALSRGVIECRWRLDEPSAYDEPQTLDAFRQDGATDYLLRMIMFPRPDETDNGVALSFATRKPGGFTDGDIDLLDRTMPALGLAGRTISIGRTASEALSVYLGTRTARRVLSGAIRRGQGQTISAAILFADLRGFTTLSEREDGMRVVGWLDEHLEAIGSAIERQGGEVLKFMGDGLLAIFPFEDASGSPSQACQCAISAAEMALQNTNLLNSTRISSNEPPLGLGIALHAGQVVYGNVGASRRLDFTVIGTAVNEASRM
jgi:adenylate cyclase